MALPRTLVEACKCHAVWALSAGREGYGLDLPEDDFVKQYAEFRAACPNKGKVGHEAFCSRCDNSFPSEIGGANWLKKAGWQVTNPLESQPDPIEPLKASRVSRAVWEHVDSSNQLVPLAPKNPGAKIEEPSELSVQEGKTMSDTEATRDLFRELLGMTTGGTAGGRGPMFIPDEIMDSMAGDAAQDELARQNLIMEMDRREGRMHDPRFVAIDLMEMEADDVDDFLSSARKKIIKRSKATRKACCSRIGGVLDQMMGPAGGEYLDGVEADDRGKHDPIGGADDAKTYRMVKESYLSEMDNPLDHIKPRPGYTPPKDGPFNPLKNVRRLQTAADFERAAANAKGNPEAQRALARIRAKRGPGGVDSDIGISQDSVDVDLLSFIAEEFFHWEHDQNCAFADPNFSLFEAGPLGEAEKFIQKAIKKPGALRDHYGVREGEEIPAAKAQADYNRLSKKADEEDLSGDELKLFRRLQLFLKVLKPASQKEDYDMEPSNTAHALSGFMEACSVNSYPHAKKGGGKGRPDSLDYGHGVGQHKLKHRDDDHDYPTELAPAKGGYNKTAGAPQSVTTRITHPGDPIGEGFNPEFAFRKGETREEWRKRTAHLRKGAKPMADDVYYDPRAFVVEGSGGARRMHRRAEASLATTVDDDSYTPEEAQIHSARSPRARSKRDQQLRRIDANTGWAAGKRYPTPDEAEAAREGDTHPRGLELRRARDARRAAPGARPWEDSPRPPSAAALARAAEKWPMGDDVYYDGPQISETAYALANFMESKVVVAKMKSMQSRSAGEADGYSERKDQRTPHLGGPLEKAAAVRKQAAKPTEAGEGPRYDGDNDPIGDAGAAARKPRW